MSQSRSLDSCLLTVALGLLGAPLAGQTAITEWLVLGPLAAPATSGAAEPEALPEGFLSFDTDWPEHGDQISWFDGRTVAWTAQAARNGDLTLPNDQGIAFAVAYLNADRWQKIAVDIEGNGQRRVWLDGNALSGEAVLEQGSHWLLVETQTPGDGSWSIHATVNTQTEGASVQPSTRPRRPPTLTEIEQLPNVTGMSIDPMGRYGTFLVRSVDMSNDRWVTALQLRDLQTGRGVRELGLNTQATSPVWSRDGSHLAFLTATDQQGGSGVDVWVWNPDDGEARRILRSEPGVSSLQFSGDGSWLYFTGTVTPDSAKNTMTGAARLTDVWERWSFWKSKAQLYAVHVDQGTRVTLAGDVEYSVSAPALSPDGRTFAYGREVRTPERPFIRVEIWMLDLSSLESRKLLDLNHEAFSAPQGYAWSPDGRALAFCASSRNLLSQDDQDFNVFETELYAVSIDAPRLVPLSEGSIPSVGALGCAPQWSDDGRIYLKVQNGSRNVLARSRGPVVAESLPGATLEMIPLPDGETMGPYDISGNTLVAAYESPVASQTIHRVNLANGESSELFSPVGDTTSQADMPSMHDWTFTDEDGWEIDGWYLTPPDFDPSRKYPTIVWYYGGTVATSRTFDRRLVSYAAQGYVVYVLNPAGAPGWGQEFSDMHVNDWGYPAGSDIIEGVTRFAAEHSFVDTDRIGNFGHSYGGFMTMHMATRTDLFAASASIAGISNIANYWGSGWTGYSYTEGTCQGCYPWNRRDVYVERSPLFQADRITTPLLLIHGTDDTNVVPTESEQMFTALRVLNKETELIRFFGENHGVNSKPSVQLNRDMILLEWFDMHLCNRPDAWRHRWGEDGDPKTVTATDGGRTQDDR